MLATTKVEDFNRFLKVFSTKGAEKRKQHGSKGATVFRDPTEADRVWVIFDWDEQGFRSFLSDPEVPAIIKEAGHVGKPQPAVLGGQYGLASLPPVAAPKRRGSTRKRYGRCSLRSVTASGHRGAALKLSAAFFV